jgi:hypothetical protein
MAGGRRAWATTNALFRTRFSGGHWRFALHVADAGRRLTEARRLARPPHWSGRNSSSATWTHSSRHNDRTATSGDGVDDETTRATIEAVNGLMLRSTVVVELPVCWRTCPRSRRRASPRREGRRDSLLCEGMRAPAGIGRCTARFWAPTGLCASAPATCRCWGCQRAGSRARRPLTTVWEAPIRSGRSSQMASNPALCRPDTTSLGNGAAASSSSGRSRCTRAAPLPRVAPTLREEDTWTRRHWPTRRRPPGNMRGPRPTAVAN